MPEGQMKGPISEATKGLSNKQKAFFRRGEG